MAKKTVINDFSALKGKVDFSEQPVADNKKSVQQHIAGKVRKSEEGVLKVGQSVVLMDSDLRGRIVSIGRKVGGENSRRRLSHSRPKFSVCVLPRV